MKKELKVIAVVLAGIIVFLAGFGLGTTKGGIKIDVNVGGTNSASSANTGATVTPTPTPTPDTTAPAPAPTPDTTASTPASDNNADTKPADNNSGKPSAIPSTPKEIAAKYNEVLNALKKQENVTIHKVSAVNIECTECSKPTLQGTVNSILQMFMKGSDENVQFTGGKGNKKDGSEVWINDFITPGGREAAVTENDLASATAAAEGAGYKMTLKFKSESATFDGTTGTEPTSHKTAMDPLNLATLELPMGAKITQASMTYPGATIEATVDASGNLTNMHLLLPLEGKGTGKLGLSLEVGLKGELDDTYTITY